MKKIIIIISLFFISNNAYADSVDMLDYQNDDIEYIDLNYKTQYIHDSNLKFDEKTIVQRGEQGQAVITHNQNKKIIKQPKNEVIKINKNIKINMKKPIDQLVKESSIDKFNQSVNNNLINYQFINHKYYPIKIHQKDLHRFNQYKYIDANLFNLEMLELINNYRQQHQLKPLKIDLSLNHGSLVRVNELLKNKSIKKYHIRPNQFKYYTAFDINDAEYHLGENLLIFPYQGNPYEIVSEKYLAIKSFNEWMKNEKYKRNILKHNYKSIITNIKLINKDQYQFFVVQQTLKN